MRRLRWLPLLLLAAVIGLAASSLLFSTFMIYDDEGYVLLSLKTFTEGGGLYERVYSQYGPFFFLFNQGLHLAGLQFTNTDGRLLTLVYWLGAAGLCASLVWRVTRSHVTTVFTLGGTYLHLWPMTSEPSHPGGFIVFFTALAAWLGVRWSAAPRKFALAMGAIGAALMLTKINVGVLFFAATGAWWVLHLDDARWSRRWRVAVAAGALVLLPVALMHKIIDQKWVLMFALAAAMGGGATVLAAARGAPSVASWRHLGVLATTALTVTLLTGVAIMAQGTSFSAMIEGVLLGPLRHPLAYTGPFHWRDGSVLVALGSLTLVTWVGFERSGRSLGAVAAGRLLAAGFYLVSWLISWPVAADNFMVSYGLVAVWLFVQPLGEDRATQPARTWLALLVGTQALHAFPVAGSQISWGTFLWVPLLAIGIHDLVRVQASSPAPAVRRLRALASVALVLATTARCGEFAWLGITRVRGSDPLHLPGADALRLPEHFSTALRLLSRNASAHADLLFSLPGLLSFHLWTGVPPPTTTNTTHWFNLLSAAQQEAIRERLAAAPRSCLIVQRDLYDFLLRVHVPTSSPLNIWLQANYESAFALEGYEFWVRKGRSIAALGTAVAREAEPGVTPHYQLALTLAEPALRDVADIELGWFNGDYSQSITTWSNPDAQLRLTPLNSAGLAAGPARSVKFPFSAAGVVRLELLTDRFPPGFPIGKGVLYLRDATGRHLAEARFVR
ncbi:MAG: hypothetical protein EXS32_12455 [Opitutus sp.]|nr:hypothetical protein [Opitutus sp.]